MTLEDLLTEGRAWTLNLMSAQCAMKADQQCIGIIRMDCNWFFTPFLTTKSRRHPKKQGEEHPKKMREAQSKHEKMHLLTVCVVACRTTTAPWPSVDVDAKKLMWAPRNTNQVYSRDNHTGLISAQVPHLSWESPALKMSRSWGNISLCFPEFKLFPHHPIFACRTWYGLHWFVVTFMGCQGAVFLPHLGFGTAKVACCVTTYVHGTHQDMCKVCTQIK